MKEIIRRFVPRYAINRYNMVKDMIGIRSALRYPSQPYVKGKYPAGINLYGDFESGTGLSRSLNLLKNDIVMAGITYTMHQVDELTGIPAEEKNEIPTAGKTDIPAEKKSPHAAYAVNVFHVQPHRIPALFKNLPAEKRDGHYNIAHWVWETPDIPKEWIPAAELFDEIWTPSVFAAKAFRKITDKPIKVYPHAVAGKEPVVISERAATREKYGIPQDAFAPVVIYDGRSGAERKNPDAAIKAFNRAFSDKDKNVFLIIKAKSLSGADMAHLKRLLDNGDRYVIIQEFLSHEDTLALLACSDVLLSLHRAEGFGLPVAEMMSLGGVVLSTDYSATGEFVDDKNGCPVAYRLIRTKKDHSVYRAGTVWADPDIEDAAKKLRRLYEDPEIREKLGKEAKKTVSDKLSAEKTGARIQKRISAICG